MANFGIRLKNNFAVNKNETLFPPPFEVLLLFLSHISNLNIIITFLYCYIV